MKTNKLLITCAIVILIVVSTVSHAATVDFSGYRWEVRPPGTGGPGPNNWDPNNVWVDGNGWLHLRLTQKGNKCYCPEVYTQNRFGFGRYQFWIVGRVDNLDKNVVFGLFNYPTPDVGPDGTHEIDIEFAKWGNQNAPIGNYTVWPTSLNVNRTSRQFPFTLMGDFSTHRFTWSPTSVFFQSQHGHYDDNSNQFSSWLFQPPNPAAFIAQKPMPVHINLWCFQGKPPISKQPVEIIVRAFNFTPL